MLEHQERYEERAKASVCEHWGLALVDRQVLSSGNRKPMSSKLRVLK